MLKLAYSNKELELVMPGNRFTNAAVVTQTKPPPKKPTVKEVVIEGMEELAALKQLKKSVDGAIEIKEAAIKLLIKNQFVEDGCRMEMRPPNFKAVEGLGEASCQLRARSINSALSEEEIELFRQHDIPMEEIHSVETCFRFNPKYTGDMDLLNRIDRQLSRVKDVPDDLIEKQEGISRWVAAEGALDALFKKGHIIVRQLLESAGTLAMRAKFNHPSLDRAYAVVGHLLGNGNDDEDTPRPARRRAA
jgi:hypothetical protein